jgi:hypothetical protein
MEKTTVFGLPLNPLSALEQLKGASFCVSYATRKKLTTQLNDAIRLVGEDGVLLVDNGAFSAFQAGVDTMNDEAYLQGFAKWANDIADRCPQAVIVFPDVIDGTAEQNKALIIKSMGLVYADRAMPIWHMHEPIEQLLWMCQAFTYVGIGSSKQYFGLGAEWHARIKEMFAAIDAWEIETGFTRPRLHIMRAQKFAHLYPFDSSDSTNVAVNHNRWARDNGVTENHVGKLAARVDAKIQASAGPAAQHQIEKPIVARPFDDEFAAELLTNLGFEVAMVDEDLAIAA